MAKRNESQEDPARVLELDRESVELRRPTMHVGVHRNMGESVDVYPFERRHWVDAGYVEGDYEDIASEAEKAQGNLNALIPPHERDDIVIASTEELWEKGDAVGSDDDENAVTAPEDPNASSYGSEKSEK